MIVKELSVKNIGPFKDRHTFDFLPASNDKNVTIIRGKNGVGKSTILDAIKLCLQGSLTVGSRATEAQYESYLLDKASRGHWIVQESVLDMTFDFFQSGTPYTYRVIRSWQNDSKSLNERLQIFENGEELTNISKKEKNIFLRELLQPGYANIMFVDGEKLQSLYHEANLSAFIADSCHALFGIGLVNLLNKDLDVFINKSIVESDNKKLNNDLAEIEQKLTDISIELQTLERDTQKDELDLEKVKEQILTKENEVSTYGRSISEKLDELTLTRQFLEQSVLQSKKELTDIYNGLGPFSLCTQLCLQLVNQLKKDQQIEKWQLGQDLITAKLGEINQFFSQEGFWKSQNINQGVKSAIRQKVEAILTGGSTEYENDSVVHQISDTERNEIAGWIDIANQQSPTIKEITNKLSQDEELLKTVQSELATFSKEKEIKPLMDELQHINKRYGALESQIDVRKNKTQALVQKEDFYKDRKKFVTRHISEQQDNGDKIRLAQDTKLVLEEYAKELLAQKLSLLSKEILGRFNSLCRKSQYLDDISIDHETFQIKLFKTSTEVEHKHLSAGEKQLLWMSVIWGLRSLTNVSLPFLIDTPVARLDHEHRVTLVKEYLMNTDPQVIVLGTDVELDEGLMDLLAPATAHRYELIFDNDSQSTRADYAGVSELLEMTA